MGVQAHTSIALLRVAAFVLLTSLFSGGCSASAAGAAPAKNSSGAPIRVVLDPTHLRPFSPTFLGANSGYERNSFNWDDLAFQRAMQNLNFVKTLRVPAGELANFWDWKSGRIVANYDHLNDVRFAHNAYPGPLGELATESALLHATHLFVLNMLSDPVCVPPAGGYCSFNPTSPNLGYQLQLLAAAHSMGFNLRYLELGNEYYIEKKAGYTAVYPNPANASQPLAAVVYGRLVTQWIKAIKQSYPDVKIAVVGADINNKTYPRKASWLSGLFDPACNSASVGGDGQSSLKGADAVTLHIYPGPGLPPNTQINTTTSEDMLGAPFKLWNTVKANDLTLIPPNMPIWFTEYGLGGRQMTVNGTWAHGLFTATMTLLFLEDNRVQIATHHELVGNALSGDLYLSANALADKTGPSHPPPTTLYGRSATADALSVVGEAMTDADQAQHLTFIDAPTITDSRHTSYPALYGWSFTQGTSRRLVILNLYNQPLTIDLRSLSSSRSYDQIAGNPGTLVTGGLDGSPTKLTETRGTMTSQLSLTLPSFSITAIY
jgi:hypothetical protein